ncbi:AraC family transcriptional regulator [Catenovulum sp. SX2]|uniref:AraC family transcriptional regulator n=1 Tax=Catenovulum sp. SX2 TaxID=3398614 RepID=UPI003F84E013
MKMYKQLLKIALVVSSLSFASGFSNLAMANNSELNQSIQDLKQQVLELNRKLFILEEDLLFPASNQLAVFISLDVGQFFKLDSVELKLNDQPIAGTLYTDRQRTALEQGGIQKLFIGNIKEGEHNLTAFFIGLDKQGNNIKKAKQFSFEKLDEASMIEFKLVDDTGSQQAKVEVEEWVL